MPNIPELFDEILQRFTAIGLKTAETMLPGLTEVEIHRLTKDLPFVLPRSAIELYKCSEGEGSNADSGLLPYYSMLPLSEMLKTYHELSNASDYPRFKCGDTQWFPMFDDGCCDYYGIRCGQGPSEDGPILYDDNEGDHRDCVTLPKPHFNNLESMLRTILRCIETGVYFVNEKGLLDEYSVCTYNDQGQLIDVDNSKLMSVVHECNPGIGPWY